MIDKLEMFIALAREEHFGRAAAACGVAQPTLSAALRQLEDQLGVTLVWRGSRFRGLTPEGQRALEWARRIVGDARALRAEMKGAQGGLSGNLRLAAIPTALPLVARLTARFAAKRPDVRVSVLSRTSAEILSMLENMEIDAGISYLDAEPTGRLTATPLYEERYTLVVNAGNPLAGRDGLAWADLAATPLCLLTPDMQNRRIIDRQLDAAGAGARPRIESNSVIVLISHVLTGLWATILPATTAAFFVAGGAALRAIPLHGPDVRHSVGLIAPLRAPPTPVLAALIREAEGIADL
jgi:DNA-binding transcriptional LysR family regulator